MAGPLICDGRHITPVADPVPVGGRGAIVTTTGRGTVKAVGIGSVVVEVVNFGDAEGFQFIDLFLVEAVNHEFVQLVVTLSQNLGSVVRIIVRAVGNLVARIRTIGGSQRGSVGHDHVGNVIGVSGCTSRRRN